MAALKQRHNKWEARVRVPTVLQPEYAGRKMLYRTLAATDRRAAKIEAAAWEVGLKAEWESRRAGPQGSLATLRTLYDTIRASAEKGEYSVHGLPDAYDDVSAGIEHELEKLEASIGSEEPSKVEAAKIAALQDAKSAHLGKRVSPRRELELSFRELAAEHMTMWRTTPGLKATNTPQQKQATFDLFASFFGERPIREVSRADGAKFVDALRRMDPNWARTGKAREDGIGMSWSELQRKFGSRATGLSDATVNRHVATLSALWKWAEEREHCDGRNPFDGHRRNLKNGKNKQGYVAWEMSELEVLFDPPPRRDDLKEIMVVALYTGMRLNEIASLTNGQVRRDGDIPFLDIRDAKTLAGIRKVPLHPMLAWLEIRAKVGEPQARLWPSFNDEGPGGKPGGDAGKEFSRHKLGKGFDDRRKVFHSFRKNFVGQLEEAGVPQNEVAQIVGHEKQGMTFGTYGRELPLSRLAEVVALVEYPSSIATQ